MLQVLGREGTVVEKKLVVVDADMIQVSPA